MIHWTSRICETCKYWIKDKNECPFHGSLDRVNDYGNNMIVIDCTCYEEGQKLRCSNCKHWTGDPSPCHLCYNKDKWETK